MIFLEQTIEQIKKMKTIDQSQIYGELKIETQKEMVYIDVNEKSVYLFVYVNGYINSFWHVEEYTFDEWDLEVSSIT